MRFISKKFLLPVAILCYLQMMADIPPGYYQVLEGKSGAALKEAVKKAAKPDEYTKIKYGEGSATTPFKTWQAFELTDVRLIRGKRVWWDMYSNNLSYVEEGHSSLNIEHSVANSWWGGEKGDSLAYCDLMHLNPSDAEANRTKSNYPLGLVGTKPSFDNGLVKIGSPAAGYGGGASTVFEPADEYKGDFARAYLYIFTAYDDIPWREDKLGEKMYTLSGGKIDLQPWTAQMLLKWAAEDPVDDKEIKRNEEIYKCQKNRNPFIDYPSLPEYIWGEKKGETFNLSGNEAQAINRPADPQLDALHLTGVNTYTGDYWKKYDLQFSFDEGDLWISLDGGEYQRYGNTISLPAGNRHGEKHQLKAYLTKEIGSATRAEGDKTLRSSVVSITMTVKDPTLVDYTKAVWEPVESGSNITEDYHLILSADKKSVMGSAINSTFMPEAGLALMDERERNVVKIPEESAMVKLVPAADSKYLLQVFDGKGESKGYWTCTTDKKMSLKADTGTPADVSIAEDGTATISFGETPGSLQYNKSNPRFLNYKSSQGKIKLYHFKEFVDNMSFVPELPADIDDTVVSVSGNNIYPGEGGAVYDLNGRRVGGEGLEPGIYIGVTRTGKSVKVRIGR